MKIDWVRLVWFLFGFKFNFDWTVKLVGLVSNLTISLLLGRNLVWFVNYKKLDKIIKYN